MAKGSKAIGQTGKGKTAARGALPIWFASSDTWDSVRADLPPEAAAFAKASGYAPKPGALLICPDPSGQIACALFGLEAEGARKSHDPFLPGKLAAGLPTGLWRFANAPGERPNASMLAALAFELAGYSFARYRKPLQERATLLTPDGVDAARIARIANAMTIARDLINTPANDMGPDALEAAALDVAKRYGAKRGFISS